MKALLILDRPICCELCYLNREREKGRYCVITNTYDKKYGSVKDDCPLKSLPKKKDIHENVPVAIFVEGELVDAYSVGWNDCLDEILGEE